ncbi:MAG: O-antigen ligase family protein [Acidobacteria bacterium]|nr:O-antigen ligase family protein [Acidobacteriota bacterium]
MAELALALAATVSVLAFGGVKVFYFLPAQLIILAAAFVQFWRYGWPSISRLTSTVLAILVAIPLLQVIPLPEGVLEILSPGRAKLALEFSAVGASLRLPPTVTLQSYESTAAFLRLLCYLMTFLLAYQSYKLGEGRGTLARLLIGLGVIEALYGLVQYLTGSPYVYTYARTSGMIAATGTYVNYNHFAGLLEMVLPFLVAQLWLHPLHGSSQRHSASWRQILAGPQLANWMLRLGLFLVVFLALIFSQSRSGILAGIAGMFVSGLLAFPKGRKGIAFISGFAIVGLLFIYSAWIGLSPVLDRFENLSLPPGVEPSRTLMWKDTFSLIQDFPVLGSGLGTFPWVSLRYQTAPVTVRYEHAHNDYLEFAADIGIGAALVLFCSLWVLAIRVARKSISLDRWSEKRLAAACAGSLIALLIHSLTDFNLQVPANALIFSWIAGTAASLASRPISGSQVISHQ